MRGERVYVGGKKERKGKKGIRVWEICKKKGKITFIKEKKKKEKTMAKV